MLRVINSKGLPDGCPQLAILKPDIVLLVGLLAIQTCLGRVSSLQAVVGTAAIKEGVRYLPLPHPSGVSR